MDQDWKDGINDRLTVIEGDVKALTALKNFIAGIGAIVALVVGGLSGMIATHFHWK